MARLILPCKSSCLAKTSLLGFISSAPLRATSKPRCLQNPVRYISKHRGFISSERDKQDRRRLICAVATEPLPQQVEESKMDTPKEIFLKDYKLPDYYFDSVGLTFLLGEEKTIVSSKITVLPRVEGSSSPLVLDGADLKLLSVKVNGEELKNGDYHLESRHLTILSPPSGKFTLEIVTEIYPHKNTSLEGLYKSSGNFCTQCEAEGFRKITYYQDRPDIMSKYTVRIEADKSLYPVLLSNGNLLEQGDLEGGKHYVLWEDPFKKPCYLFALVAGQLESRDDVFVTRSGRNVSLRIWTPAQDVPKTAHAMYSLKAAMKWDEDVFGLEYDLDLFNIVAVPDFNMGAMENKSLNIFNSKLVLASPETASDADYAAILGVIGHEYFHNWTGNRWASSPPNFDPVFMPLLLHSIFICSEIRFVWLQHVSSGFLVLLLSLKEGLTVFRDQEFSSDMGSRTVKRISDVSRLRISQFPQDAGPMAHPVRPHSYIKVYEKGAEVVRMYKTLLGSQGFRKGMDLYFKRHDAQAVTCEDFFAAMRDANDTDFANFLLWYSQAGTPLVKVKSSYDAEAHTFTLKFSQEVPATPGQPVKEPMFIPVVLGLLDTNGKDMPLTSVYHDGALKSIASDSQPAYSTILRVTKLFIRISGVRGFTIKMAVTVVDKEEEFVFSDIPEQPVPSLLRGFSAPIRLESDLSDSELFFLLANDSDEFNRWEAGQVLARKLMLSLVMDFQQGRPLALNPKYVQGLRSILSDSNLDKEFIAKALTLPGEGEIMDMMDVADPDAVHAVRSFIRKQLASELKSELLCTVENNRSSEEYVFNHPNMARRALKNIALAYLASLEDKELTELALHEYKTATNMTDQFAALAAIAQNPGKSRDEVLADFYTKWQDDYLVVNKWFALQAMSDVPGNVENVRNLLNHPAFDLRNPNKVYSLIGGFCGSPVNFHAKDGSGYKFLGEIVVQLDKINPQVASRMVSAFSRWKRYDETRQNLAKAQLEMIVSANGLSENVFEIASKSCSCFPSVLAIVIYEINVCLAQLQDHLYERAFLIMYLVWNGRQLRATSKPRCLQNPVRNISKHRGFISSERDKQDRRRLICAVATEPLPKQVEESKMDTPKEIFLKDYKLPDYYFDSVGLTFLLGEEKTIVSSKITVLPRVEGSSAPLVLDGADLKLLSVKVNGEELKNGDYHLESRHLTILSPPSGKFTLEIVTEIYPQKNTSLEGLYKSSGNFCTQCEAEGFRKFTYYQDRPDIMSKYTVRIEADKSLYPVLLSNGNLLEQGDLEGGKHFVLWEDPFKKPCYLFALVAGQLESRDDVFVTRSGRNVSLRIWTPAQDVPKTAHAMYSLKAAMKWDEDVFGLEYDLDLFNIVAVPDFDMGAMENKSLNIFNSKLVLASPETASDADYAAILRVIGHELSLKEGLTVFRDQEFSSDMGSRTVKRISDVSRLRISQFPQDAGPMAHPVRPHSYIKVYEKGAEVVRMYKTLLGSQGFRKGMDLYFKRHDAQAVTCEDFFAAMRDANDTDFANFLLWYSQAGTPLVKVKSSYDAEAHTFTLKFSQEVPATPGQPVKEPMFIPVVLGLLDTNGKDMPLLSVYHDGALKSIASDSQPPYSTILRVTKKEEEFVFSDIPEKPVPSLLRGFSAPIRLESDLSDSELFFLLAHDSDEFNRWEAGQVLARKLMLSLVMDFQQGRPLALNPKYVQGLRSILSDSNLDKEFIANALTLPGEGEIMDMMDVADPDAVHAVRSFIRKKLASELKSEFLRTVENNRSSEEYVFNHPNMAMRALKNLSLAYLASLEDRELTELALHEYKTATNMTEQFAALAAIAQNPGKTRDEVLADFYTKWQDDYLVVNKWFALQAMSDVPGNVENVRKLLNHPAFDLRNPNKVSSLIGGFRGSPVNFHAKDGSGYKFLGEIVVQLDKINPQVASRTVSAFSRWKRYDETRQNLAKAQLEMIVSANGLSENVFEIASKSLAA
uniref:Puromycin-sensitive aminopeptidase n=1 Tax=Salix viminalis TaxID=40686 RepID=A0A6N2L5W5_SALVM